MVLVMFRVLWVGRNSQAHSKSLKANTSVGNWQRVFLHMEDDGDRITEDFEKPHTVLKDGSLAVRQMKHKLSRSYDTGRI